jgi:dihydroorotate dehydrogenase
MPLYESLVRPLLFLMEPERAHELALWAVRKGIAGRLVHPLPALPQGGGIDLFGVRFPNCVGLAAGFEKGAVAVSRWRELGFGFVEVGTVTRHAQPGNPRPRLFRLPSERALINRMGFNNPGADEVARRLSATSAGIPLGVNIGKSKATPLEEAVSDYAYSFRLLSEFADYVVVNVSSPNTPGLRDLQEKESLRAILSSLREIDFRKPLFVKLSPDLSLGALEDVVSVTLELGLTGMVCTNTTVSRSVLAVDPGLEGGLSGAPLRDMADEALRFVRELAPDLVLIGVGGVMSGEDARRKMSLGADLVQVYTGWVYGGPGFVGEVVKNL